MFFDRYAELCKKENKTPTGVALELNVARSTVSYWKSGATPKQEILRKIAERFNVSVDYLLGSEDESKESDIVKFAHNFGGYEFFFCIVDVKVKIVI